MQAIFLEAIKLGLSEARLNGYKRYSGDSDFDCLLRYLWNSKLSESFYVPLQNLEVVLRNRIHDSLTDHYKTKLWFDRPHLLGGYQPKQLGQARKKLKKVDRNNADKIVAELNFGFWSALANKRYSATLVPVMLRDCFKQVTPIYRKRFYLASVLDNLRLFRNRVFHHEPIWYYKDLPDKHRNTMQLIFWLSPELFRITNQMTSFHAVYSKGTLPYKEIALTALTPGRLFSY